MQPLVQYKQLDGPEKITEGKLKYDLIRNLSAKLLGIAHDSPTCLFISEIHPQGFSKGFSLWTKK